MRIEELMCRDVYHCRPDDSLEAAARPMWDHDCGCAPVCSGRATPRVSDDREFLIAELRRELEHVGLSEAEAEAVAASRIDDSTTSHSDEKPRQHVVPVASGWLVIRDLPNVDIGLFDEKEAAIEAARELAAASGGHVIVHDE